MQGHAIGGTMIHVIIKTDPDDPNRWIAKDVDVTPPRVIYSGDNIFAATRARRDYIARCNEME